MLKLAKMTQILSELWRKVTKIRHTENKELSLSVLLFPVKKPDINVSRVNRDVRLSKVGKVAGD